MLSIFEQNLMSISEHTVIAYLVLWLLYIFISRKIDSITVTLTLSVFFSLSMHVLTPYLFAFASTGGVLPIVVWHLSFVLIHAVFFIALRKLHQTFKLELHKVGLIVAGCYAINSIIHLLRLSEKVIFETNFLSSFYTYGILSVNTLLIFIFVICIFQSRK